MDYSEFIGHGRVFYRIVHEFCPFIVVKGGGEEADFFSFHRKDRLLSMAADRRHAVSGDCIRAFCGQADGHVFFIEVELLYQLYPASVLMHKLRPAAASYFGGNLRLPFFMQLHIRCFQAGAVLQLYLRI